MTGLSGKVTTEDFNNCQLEIKSHLISDKVA
jgi:hypothetical protein